MSEVTRQRSEVSGQMSEDRHGGRRTEQGRSSFSWQRELRQLCERRAIQSLQLSGEFGCARDNCFDLFLAFRPTLIHRGFFAGARSTVTFSRFDGVAQCCQGMLDKSPAGLTLDL